MVGYIITIDFRCIVGYRILGDRVYDLSAVFIFWKISETPAPVICLCYNCPVNLFPVSQKTYCNLVRPVAVRIVIVVPGLRAFDVNCLRCVTVGQVVIIILRSAALGITVQVAGLYYAVLYKLRW